MKNSFATIWSFTKHIVYLHIILLAGCGLLLSPTNAVATRHQLEKIVVTGTRFQHVVYKQKTGYINANGERKKILHVYLGGDGTPWLDKQPSPDPTPHNPLTLRLMVQDSSPAIFVGRPCYYGLANSDNCSPELWTGARYSQTVVESMAAVIEAHYHQYEYDSIVLFGYSGGGVLATLLVDQMDTVDALVTIAANLDTAAWIRHHRYEPMLKSINPAIAAVLPKKTLHLHLHGGLDTVVPSYTTENFFKVNTRSQRWLYPDFDHVCCWVEQWPQILSKIDTKIKARSAVQYEQFISRTSIFPTSSSPLAILYGLP